MPSVNVLFVVCHPDDEALWIGGLLHGMSRISGITVHVVCLSGFDESSPRQEEFEAAKAVAQYHAGVVMGSKLRPADQPLPPIAPTVIAGITKLNLLMTDVDLLITHSPFGDEHMHPHHIQACEELYTWTIAQNISFGFFSCLPIANCYLEPTLKNMSRFKNLQPLNYARCRYGLFRSIIRRLEGKPWRYPSFYTQWLVDAEVKQRMLACYQSIDLSAHEQGYAMFNNNVESLYLFDHRGVALLKHVLPLMEVPGSRDYFPGTWTNEGVKRRILNKIFFWRR